MPRPKRTKVAPTILTSRVTDSPSAPTTAKRDAELSSQSSERITSNSDDSEGLVTRNESGLYRRGVAPQEATMTGALAPEDLAGGRLRPPRGRQRAALSRIAREGDHAKAIEALKARMLKERAAKKQEQEQERAALAGADMVPNSQEDHLKTTGSVLPTESAAVEPSATATGDNARIARPVTATGSLRRESSVLADFKRRPRQPSLLAMVQARHQQQAEESDNSDGSLEDFQPDDESTPFVKSKSQLPKPQSTPSASSATRQESSSSRKRKHASIEPIEIQVPASQPLPPGSSPPPVEPVSELSQHEIPENEVAEEPSLPVVRSTQLSSQLGKSTLAPPQSSSPPPDPLPKSRSKRPAVPPRNAQNKFPKTPKAPTNTLPTRALSPPRSPQSSASSIPSPVRKPKQSPVKPLTTASLQNLLPRRRARPKAKEASAFDVPSSSDDLELSSDQDELSLHHVPNESRAKKAIIAKSTPLKKSKGRMSATYGRRKVPEASPNGEDSGSEREGGDDGERLSPNNRKNGGRAIYGKGGAAVKGEMRRLAQKFREVDEWALEIEDVTPHSGSSQMVDAR